MALADLSGDGLPDLITAEFGPSLSVRLGSGSSFAAPKTYPAPSEIQDIAIADLNHDGLPDVVANGCPGGGPQVGVFLALNGDSLGPYTIYPVPTFGPTIAPVSVALGDVTGDGHIDIVSGEGNGGGNANIWVLPGLGTGAFGSAVGGPRTLAANNVTDIVVTHLNGDATPDIAAGSTGSTGGFVSAWVSNGGGSFTSLPTMVVGNRLPSLCAGDIDGDSDIDLVAVCRVTSDAFRSVAVFRNQGAASFSGPTYYSGLQGGFDAVLADMDEDGRLDVVSAISGNVFGDPLHNVGVLRNDGQGGFVSGQKAVTINDSELEVIADFNRDGKPDVAMVVPNDVEVRLGNGDGTFAATGSTLGVGFGSVSRLLAAEVTGDGIPDLLVGTSLIGYYFQGVGNGTFGPATVLGEIPVAVLDVNRDGWLDVLCHLGGSALTVRTNFGGTFVQTTSFNSSVGQDAFAIGDWDRDGDSDIAVVGDGGLSVFRYDAPSATFQETVVQSAVDFSDVCAGDFTRDGILDLAARTDGEIRTYRGNPGGTFTFDRSLGTMETKGWTVRAWDADMDGRLDLMTSGVNTLDNSLPSKVWQVSTDIFLGGGDGQFGQRASYAVGLLQGEANRPVTVGDLNRDGVNDVVAPVFGVDLTPPRGLQVAVASPPAKDHDYQAATFYPTLTNPRTVALGDLNRDGKLDVVSGSPVQNPGVAVCLNVGSGALGASTTLAQSWNAGHVELADFNRDGKLDIAASHNGSGPRVYTMLGAGDGTFGTRVDYFINAGLDFEVGDLNRDGILDIVTASQDSIQWLIGTGTGTFTAGPRTAINPCYDLDLADLNRDGWLDVVCAGGVVKVFYSNGSGFGAPQTLAAPITTCQAVCVGDFNRDGFLDIEANEDGVYCIFWGAASSPYTTFATTTLTFGALDVKLGQAESNGIPFLYISNNTGFVAVVRVETNGTLTPVGTYTVLDTPIAVALGNANEDASVDFVSVGSGTSFLAVNLHGFGSVTGVQATPPAVVSAPTLRQNYPNPFNPRTTIRFELPKADHARLRVYDVHGRLVATLHNGAAPAGVSLVEWRGESDSGVAVASGVYHYELVTASGRRESRKMVVMK